MPPAHAFGIKGLPRPMAPLPRLRPAALLAALLLAALVPAALPPAQAASPSDMPGSGDRSTPAPTPDAPAEPPPKTETWAIHGQSTFTEIYQPAFRSPYRGPQSLDPGSRGRETIDVTLYGGVRPWTGAEIWVNPEIDQGFGPSNTFGLGGYVSAEAYKLGSGPPYVRLPRLFLRQTIDLGGAVQPVAPDLNQLAGTQTADRVIVTIGKFSSFDVFDTNEYAHDPRNDFLNWALIDAGTFDQAGDAWGFSYGASVEWYTGPWTLRGGVFDLPTYPTYKYLDNRFFRQQQYIAELERRYTIFGRDGAIKIDGYFTRGRLGSYARAVRLAQATGGTPDIQAVLDIRNKAGTSLNLQQALTTDLGLFARAGWQDGSSSVTSYTDIDNTLSAGLSLKGRAWGRADDTIGLGVASNGISRHLKDYLNAGGLGILVGDGKLPNSGRELVSEAYYSFLVRKGVNLTADYQFVNNPAYNRDRGPVSFLGARLHAEF